MQKGKKLGEGDMNTNTIIKRDKEDKRKRRGQDDQDRRAYKHAWHVAF